MNQPVERVINRGVRASATASALCRSLEGRSFSIRITGIGLHFRLSAQDGTIRVDQDEPADAEIAGSPIALTRLLGADLRAPIRDGAVELNGDTEVAEQFSELLRMARPDFEEELSKIVGDAVAREAGDAARGLRDWLDTAGTTFTRSLGEYLQEESRSLPTRAETEEFMAGVDALANDVARLQARLSRLKDRAAESAGEDGSR